MKKIKHFAVIAIFCAAGFAGYTVYDQATMTDAERMMQANLEALTTSIESETETGYQSSKTITNYTYDDNGNLIRKESHTEKCCVSAEQGICSYSLC